MLNCFTTWVENESSKKKKMINFDIKHAKRKLASGKLCDI